MFTSWVVVVLMVVTAYYASRSMSLVPSGLSGAIEALVGGFYEFIENIVGEANARRFFPVIATIFFYVLVSNYIGLLPVSFAVGRTEPGEGETQVVFEQTTIAGIDFAVIHSRRRTSTPARSPRSCPRKRVATSPACSPPTSARS